MAKMEQKGSKQISHSIPNIGCRLCWTLLTISYPTNILIWFGSGSETGKNVVKIHLQITMAKIKNDSDFQNATTSPILE